MNLDALSTEDIATLRKAEALLSKPIRKCTFAHESVAKDTSGLMIVPLRFTEECAAEDQHFGCPHFLKRNTEFLLKTIVQSTLRKENETPEMLEKKIRQFMDKLFAIDEQIRISRTGISAIGGMLNESLELARIPPKEEAERNVTRILSENEVCFKELNILRLDLLGRVQEMLAV